MQTSQTDSHIVIDDIRRSVFVVLVDLNMGLGLLLLFSVVRRITHQWVVPGTDCQYIHICWWRIQSVGISLCSAHKYVRLRKTPPRVGWLAQWKIKHNYMLINRARWLRWSATKQTTVTRAIQRAIMIGDGDECIQYLCLQGIMCGAGQHKAWKARVFVIEYFLL